MIKRWHALLQDFFESFAYSDLVRPSITHYAFPFAPDDGQMIHYTRLASRITLRLKLPTTPQPTGRSDWPWVSYEGPFPQKLQAKVAGALSAQPLKPTLLTRRLKGGWERFFLQFPWAFPPPGSQGPPALQQDAKPAGRALAVDLGLKKVATCVVCEDNKQLSPPFLLKLKGAPYRKLERLYNHIAGVQQALSQRQRRSPSKKQRQRRQQQASLATAYPEERRRLYAKRNRLGEELAHTATNLLLAHGTRWGCTAIIIEDLRDYRPPKGQRRWSRRLSAWLRGRIAALLAYKCQERGLLLQKVCPWQTSSHCPRCTARGQKVLAPQHLVASPRGRCFHCPACGCTADRDYIAALNIYRASFIDYTTSKSLRDTSPVPYMDSGTPHPTVPGGGPERSCPHLLVAVTGKG